MSHFSARIHVLFARDVPYAVVIRRGPSKHVATIGWNRETDSFVLGQWLKGRIYERRCDLSADGKHLIYFAMNGKWESESKGSWTAISRAPYLKAISFWPKGDCWQGGGLFRGSKHYWIHDWYGSEQPLYELPGELTREPECPFAGGVGAECLGVYFPRLLRDGWQLTREPCEPPDAASRTWVFDKLVSFGWKLRKHVHATLNHPPGRGCYYDTHELLHEASVQRIDESDWDWAELDRERLVWSDSGKLFAGQFCATGLADVRELYDFNSMGFERRKVPY
jgi:hypothetical protein